MLSGLILSRANSSLRSTLWAECMCCARNSFWFYCFVSFWTLHLWWKSDCDTREWDSVGLAAVWSQDLYMVWAWLDMKTSAVWILHVTRIKTTHRAEILKHCDTWSVLILFVFNFRLQRVIMAMSACLLCTLSQWISVKESQAIKANIERAANKVYMHIR